jgi:hypothetical protein
MQPANAAAEQSNHSASGSFARFSRRWTTKALERKAVERDKDTATEDRPRTAAPALITFARSC